jgi:hypothetical protein
MRGKEVCVHEWGPMSNGESSGLSFFAFAQVLVGTGLFFTHSPTSYVPSSSLDLNFPINRIHHFDK